MPKVSGVKVRSITGLLRSLTEEAAIEAVLSDEIVDGDVVVVRSWVLRVDLIYMPKCCPCHP